MINKYEDVASTNYVGDIIDNASIGYIDNTQWTNNISSVATGSSSVMGILNMYNQTKSKKSNISYYVGDFFAGRDLKSFSEVSDFFQNFEKNLKDEIEKYLSSNNYDKVIWYSEILKSYNECETRFMFNVKNYTKINEYKLYIISGSFGHDAFKFYMTEKEYATAKLKN